LIAAGAAALSGLSCGSAGSGSPRDAGAAGRDGGSAGPDAGDAAPCPPVGSLPAEPTPRHVGLDGGVPIGQLASAVAVARCNYLSRCFALSTYVANECVDSLIRNGSWAYQACSPSDVLGGLCLWTGLDFNGEPNDDSSADLLQAVNAGVVQYDPQKEVQCIAALLTEACGGETLLQQIPACTGVFTCPPVADGGAAAADGGAPDGGSACTQLIPISSRPIRTCSTDQDCADVTQAPQGPFCVAGVCAASICGIAYDADAECTAYAGPGEPCNWNALSALNPLLPTTPGGTCATGLACHGQTPDGGLGACVVPVDVGGPCTDDTNCKPGLTCACGTCEIPPTTGPCVNETCQIGVAYCDLGSNVCHPVRPSGASCADAANSCGAGLLCGASAPGVCGAFQ
jgi:hypothetical protein